MINLLIALYIVYILSSAALITLGIMVCLHHNSNHLGLVYISALICVMSGLGSIFIEARYK